MKLFFSLIFFIGLLFGQFQQNNLASFNKTWSVREVKRHGLDEQKVTLRGHLVAKFTQGKYVFQDKSGQILVEIDPETINRSRIKELDAKTEIIIHGEIERDAFDPIEIDVEILEEVH